MVFSKSFGYAVRGVLYLAFVQDTKHFVQVEEMAKTLAVPRHFVSKILKKLVKAGVLSSSKGKMGGFAVNNQTKSLPLIKLYGITDGYTAFDQCALRMQQCNSSNPCPIHGQMVTLRDKIMQLLSATTIGELLKEDKEDFIKSITTVHQNNISLTQNSIT